MHDFALAYALSTISGLRVSYPLAALSIAAHTQIIHPPAGLSWLHADAVLCISIIACIVELVAHKLFRFDRGVHILHRVLSPLVGGTAALAVCSPHDSLPFLTLLLGGGNAFAVHSLRATARLTGSTFILGAAHPLMSFVEDGAVFTGMSTAFSSAPATAGIVFLVIACWWLFTYRPVPRRRRRMRA
jgi:hypothetical protein